MVPKLMDIAMRICKSQGFHFFSFVGGGSFKETYRVETNSGSASIALKVFRSGNSPQRSRREIEAMVSCNHPNIGKLLSVSTIEYQGERYLYTIEEYLAGGTLSQKLNNGCLPIEEVCSIGKYLIDALAHLEVKNLVHRDIKPDNILFREDRATPVIIDFGLVRNLSDESLTQTWLVQGPGSPYYASPEQLNNDKYLIDWRSDQFAVGVLLSLCCFGIHPYSQIGDNLGQTVERVAQRGSLNASFVAQAQKFGLHPVVKMVAQWPIKRFRTPNDLLASWQP